MKKILSLALLSVVACCAAAMTEEEVLGMMDAAFYRDMCYDGTWRPSRFTAQGMQLCEAYSNILVRSGWNETMIERAVLSSISNRCTDAAFFAASPRNRSIYRGAVAAVARHCGTNALATLEYAFQNSVGINAVEEAAAIVRLRGCTSEAFARYGELMHGANVPGMNKTGDLALAVSLQACDGEQTAIVTNRAVRFFLGAAMEARGCEVVADQSLCELWPAYAISSNRHAVITGEIGNVSNRVERQYLMEVKAQLESIPPGTMQMLPTNQFYNVED